MSYLVSYSRWKMLTESANGQLSNDELVAIDSTGDLKLNKAAAAAYAKMKAAAEADGIRWKPIDAYRDIEDQQKMAADFGQFKTGGKASTPGNSNHGWGGAVDLDIKAGGPEYKWLKANASKFGFSTIPDQPWHWEHTASTRSMETSTGQPKESEPELPKNPTAPDETKLAKVDQFYNALGEIASPISQQDDKTYSFSKAVKAVQTGLELLGYPLAQHGVDGLFGPETKAQVDKFQKDNSLPETGTIDKATADKITALLKEKKISDKDVEKYASSTSLDVKMKDDDFYKSLLTTLGAPITDDNLKFLYAWRQVEGGTAKNNPFNTTYQLSKDKDSTNYNSVKVKNYSTPEYGVEATARTLMLPYYTDILNGLRNDIGLDALSKSKGLVTWSGNSPTYLNLFSNVVKGYAAGNAPAPHNIA